MKYNVLIHTYKYIYIKLNIKDNTDINSHYVTYSVRERKREREREREKEKECGERVSECEGGMVRSRDRVIVRDRKKIVEE